MPKLDPGYVVAALMQRGVPQHVAQGVVMNFQDESGLDTGIQEGAPISGRGGFGLAQWTGPRRVALEQYAAQRGVDPSDPEMQFDFFMQENQGSEAKAWQQVMASPDSRTAAQNFVRLWERPASEHLATRTAKYSGQEAPGVGTYTPQPQQQTAAAGFPAPPAPFSPEKDKPPSISEQLTANLDDISEGLVSGVGKGTSSVPVAPQMAKPQSWMTEPIAAQTFNPQAAQTQRDKLAVAMARLNSGKLFVG